jgi:hypothetical protein
MRIFLLDIVCILRSFSQFDTELLLPVFNSLSA